jgi:hypothetical protein
VTDGRLELALEGARDFPRASAESIVAEARRKLKLLNDAARFFIPALNFEAAEERATTIFTLPTLVAIRSIRDARSCRLRSFSLFAGEGQSLAVSSNDQFRMISTLTMSKNIKLTVETAITPAPHAQPLKTIR